MTPFDATLPLTHARTLPAECYRSAAVAEVESRTVFGAAWQYVGRLEQVAARGAYLTAEIAGEPVLVVRGEDGTLRGFFNVCRHRAAPLLSEPCGTATKLRCRYHGWTYDLAGALRGTPEFDGVCDFEKEHNGLVPIAVDTCGPLVFVHLGTPQQSLQQFLNPLSDWLHTAKPFDGLHWHARRVYDVACNWKVYVDNYLDGGYHVSTVHPALAGVIDYRDYVTTTHGYTALQHTPLRPADSDAGRTRTGDTAHYWWAFPNFMLNHSAGVLDTNLVLPLGPDRSRVVFDFWFAAGTAEDFKTESVAVADRVQQEDGVICEEVQRGLHSRSYTTGRFSVKRENAGYHFHQLVNRCVTAGSAF